MDLEDVVEYTMRRDVTDLSCMDKILIYLEQLKEEDEDFMQLLAVKCSQQEIDWEQPWYQQGESVTRPPKDRFEDAEKDTYRKDTITKDENLIIENNWRKFRKKYGVPDKLICFARWKTQTTAKKRDTPVEYARRFLTAYLARGLKRSLYQVYRHVLTYYGCPNKRTYQSYELKLMDICFLHYPTRAVTCLSKVLGREPKGIYKYMATKFGGKLEKKRLKWTLPLATKFLKLLMKHTELSLEELKNKKIEKDVWLKMQDDMDHHYVYLHDFWYENLHVQLFVNSDVKLSRLKKKVFKILKHSDYKVWSDIRWKELVKNHLPDGFTYRFIYKLCYRIGCRYPKYFTAPLQKVVEHSLGRSRMIRYHNRRLKTVKLNEKGDLEYVRYSKSEL